MSETKQLGRQALINGIQHSFEFGSTNVSQTEQHGVTFITAQDSMTKHNFRVVFHAGWPSKSAPPPTLYIGAKRFTLNDQYMSDSEQGPVFDYDGFVRGAYFTFDQHKPPPDLYKQLVKTIGLSPQVVISKNSLVKMRQFARHDAANKLEIGGSLFGRWAESKQMVFVDYVLGPGPQSYRSRAHCRPDAKWMAEKGTALGQFGMGHIGEWHSHHISFDPTPSDGDIKTVTKNMQLYRNERFLLCIAGVNKNTWNATIFPYLFAWTNLGAGQTTFQPMHATFIHTFNKTPVADPSHDVENKVKDTSWGWFTRNFTANPAYIKGQEPTSFWYSEEQKSTTQQEPPAAETISQQQAPLYPTFDEPQESTPTQATTMATPEQKRDFPPAFPSLADPTQQQTPTTQQDFPSMFPQVGLEAETTTQQSSSAGVVKEEKTQDNPAWATLKSVMRKKINTMLFQLQERSSEPGDENLSAIETFPVVSNGVVFGSEAKLTDAFRKKAVSIVIMPDKKDPKKPLVNFRDPFTSTGLMMEIDWTSQETIAKTTLREYDTINAIWHYMEWLRQKGATLQQVAPGFIDGTRTLRGTTSKNKIFSARFSANQANQNLVIEVTVPSKSITLQMNEPIKEMEQAAHDTLMFANTDVSWQTEEANKFDVDVASAIGKVADERKVKAIPDDVNGIQFRSKGKLVQVGFGFRFPVEDMFIIVDGKTTKRDRVRPDVGRDGNRMAKFIMGFVQHQLQKGPSKQSETKHDDDEWSFLQAVQASVSKTCKIQTHLGFDESTRQLHFRIGEQQFTATFKGNFPYSGFDLSLNGDQKAQTTIPSQASVHPTVVAHLICGSVKKVNQAAQQLGKLKQTQDRFLQKLQRQGQTLSDEDVAALANQVDDLSLQVAELETDEVSMDLATIRDWPTDLTDQDIDKAYALFDDNYPQWFVEIRGQEHTLTKSDLADYKHVLDWFDRYNELDPTLHLETHLYGRILYLFLVGMQRVHPAWVNTLSLMFRKWLGLSNADFLANYLTAYLKDRARFRAKGLDPYDLFYKPAQRLLTAKHVAAINQATKGLYRAAFLEHFNDLGLIIGDDKQPARFDEKKHTEHPVADHIQNFYFLVILFAERFGQQLGLKWQNFALQDNKDLTLKSTQIIHATMSASRMLELGFEPLENFGIGTGFD